MKPGIVVSIDKARENICHVRAPRVVNFKDDGIRIHRRDATASLIEQMYSPVAPMAACSGEDVKN